MSYEGVGHLMQLLTESVIVNHILRFFFALKASRTDPINALRYE